MLYEYRIYECHPGKRDEWVQYMESVIIPFQVSKGMVVAGSFIDEEDENRYVWMRRFRDEADRERLYRGRLPVRQVAERNRSEHPCAAESGDHQGDAPCADREVGDSVGESPYQIFFRW